MRTANPDELQVVNLRDTEIKHIIMMGDSLSDRGTLYERTLCYCIPMRAFSGLEGYSPDKRFTNGWVWSDHIAASIANDFTIRRLLRRRQVDDTDIADAIITQDKHTLNTIRKSYSLDNDKFIHYRGKVWIRSYCEGGLTSHDYSRQTTWNVMKFFTRLVAATLEQKRQQLLRYDIKHKVTYQQKAETLIIEWSGANDLVTVNEEPTKEAVDRAVAARVANVRQLIAAGYHNFILFNLPNLALTPRYQAKTHEERQNAERWTQYFNYELQEACLALNREYPRCAIDRFDINALFEEIYHHPEQYLFDESKRATAYIYSADFTEPHHHLSPSKKYMFYDEIHPTADVHALLASFFYEYLISLYALLEPDKRSREASERELLDLFCEHYQKELEQQQISFFRRFRHSNLNYKKASLEQILQHALYEEGQRTRQVLVKLGWLNQNSELILKSLVLEKAMLNVKRAIEQPENGTMIPEVIV